jgi:hypothetical protein
VWFLLTYLVKKLVQKWRKEGGSGWPFWTQNVSFFLPGVLVSFASLDQITEQNNLREEGFIVAHSLREFSP